MKKTALFAALWMLPTAALADVPSYELVLKNHVFAPSELAIPADRKVKLTVKNQDSTPAEFESSDLNREKVVGANSEIVVFIGPLQPGSYRYYDEYHEDTAKGTIVVK